MAFGDYPKGRISMGSGDLMDVSDFSIAYSDGEKHVNTLRRSAAGSTSGPRTCTLSCTSKISAAGFERAYFRDYRRRKVQQFRLKVADEVFVIEGRMSNPNITSNVDGEITFTYQIVGKDQADLGQ